MSYQVERDTFISQATREGLSVDVCRKLLRYATTLQRLSEAQCNGDWPYNGDRDRPSRAHVNVATSDTSADLRAKWDSRYTTCPKCEASGVSKSAMRTSSDSDLMSQLVSCGTHTGSERVKVCPDCRTQELTDALLQQAMDAHGLAYDPSKHALSAKFNGDPRGAVLVLSTPNHPWTEDGRGRGLYVPAGKSR